MKFGVLAVLGILLFSGCIGGTGDVAPTTSPALPPAPVQVFKREVNACPTGPNQPVQTSAITGTFEVKPGYDQIIIGFHESGVGAQVSAEIRWIEEGIVIWNKPSHNVETASKGVTCGGHSHSGDGDNKAVEPGNYTVRISYSGSVALHMEVTARSTRSMDGAANHTHMALRE